MLEIGSTLKQLRQKAHLTQKDVAEKLHVTPQTISKWERNKSYPDLDYLVKLSELFNVSTDTLLGTTKPAFFARLFSKKKRGAFPMTEESVSSNERCKQVYIFSISSWINDGEWQTQRLQMKLQKELTDNGCPVAVHMFSASKIQQLAPKADLIILTPEYHFALEQLKKEYPHIPVVPLDRKDYGLLETTKIIKKLNSLS